MIKTEEDEKVIEQVQESYRNERMIDGKASSFGKNSKEKKIIWRLRQLIFPPLDYSEFVKCR